MKCSVLIRLIEHILAVILLRKKHVFGFFWPSTGSLFPTAWSLWGNGEWVVLLSCAQISRAAFLLAFPSISDLQLQPWQINLMLQDSSLATRLPFAPKSSPLSLTFSQLQSTPSIRAKYAAAGSTLKRPYLQFFLFLQAGIIRFIYLYMLTKNSRVWTARFFFFLLLFNVNWNTWTTMTVQQMNKRAVNPLFVQLNCYASGS